MDRTILRRKPRRPLQIRDKIIKIRIGNGKHRYVVRGTVISYNIGRPGMLVIGYVSFCEIIIGQTVLSYQTYNVVQ